MEQVDVTARVWQRLLEVRQSTQGLGDVEGDGDGDVGGDVGGDGHWSLGEQQALDLYGPLARRD
ncbi:MAG: hypothetical protein WD400_00800, partial [Pontimonas sp.]